MAETSSVLFHFTGAERRGTFKDDPTAFRALREILSSGEFPLGIQNRKWTTEVNGRTTHFDLDIPAVSFTETRLATFAEHLPTFGRFAIGMSVDWGFAAGVQDVVYCDSSKPNEFAHALAATATRMMKLDKNFNWETLNPLIGATEDRAYGREREWRYIGKLSRGKPQPAGLKFSPADVVIIVCPGNYVGKLRTFLTGTKAYAEFPFGILSAETFERFV